MCWFTRTTIDITSTLNRIRDGYWIKTETDDGGFFNFNNPGELPNIPRKGNNYYMEFVVWPSMNLSVNGIVRPERVEPFGTVAFPGPMRLLIGLGGVSLVHRATIMGSACKSNA